MKCGRPTKVRPAVKIQLKLQKVEVTYNLYLILNLIVDLNVLLLLNYEIIMINKMVFY